MRDPFEEVPVRSRQAVLVVSILVAALVWLGATNLNALGVVGVLAFFFIVMIGLHELGHFVFAKRAGMKVSEFFIGFGPRLWSVQRGETEYGIKALPLGGYCKIVGMTNLEEIDPADEARTFRSKGFWAKTSTLLAGPASHFVLALILMWSVLSFGGDLQRATPRAVVNTVEHTVTFTRTVDGKSENISVASPASKAGLRTGDRIHAIDGVRVSTWKQVQDAIHKNGGHTIAIQVDRGARSLTLHTQLLANGPGGTGVGYLGVSPTVAIPRPSLLSALALAPVRTAEVTRETVSGFGTIFSPSGISKYLSNFGGAKTAKAKADAQNARFVSPVGVGRYAYDAVAAGWVTVAGLLIAINVSVGFINLLPLIPFDGGHIAVAGYEAVMTKIYRRKYRVDFAKLMPVAIATLSLLAFIFLSSLFLDIAHPVANPF